MTSPHRPPIFIDALLDDPDRIRALTERHGPYAPVQRYLANEAQRRMASGAPGAPAAATLIAPNFRGDWAFAGRVLEGVEPLLHHPALVEAAGRLFETPFVRPSMVFTNITWQLPFPQGQGHTDVPQFRGFDRTRHPTWILAGMGASGLFEEERIEIATAVAWFYRGSDGGFDYWLDGPDAPPRVHEGAIHNTAVVGDNDRMFHRVRPVGRREAGLPQGLSLDSRLVHRGGDDWAIVEGDAVVAEMAWPELRISLSWKAEVYRSEEAMRRADEHVDDLTLDAVLERFEADFAARGERWERGADPLSDPALTELIHRLYVRQPTIQAA